MNVDRQTHVKHLLWRAGFGPTLRQWETLRHADPRQVARDLIRQACSVQPLVVRAYTPGDFEDFRQMDEEARKERLQQDRLTLRNLNVAWIRQMARSEAQLREKMTLFWHDHFACRLNRHPPTQAQNNTLRTYALGRFGDLLEAIARDAGMLRFLNNQQNHKDHPNENFARELLELFTLGRGHYSEQDIREAARAFTGWSSDIAGNFVFRPRQHDYGTKTFLGHTGTWDGGDISRLLLETPRTAYFLTDKIYRYLVHPQPDPDIVAQWADAFYASGYDIAALLETIFTSDHFYETRHLAARIKSPVEYLVGMMRLLEMDLVEEEGILLIQRVLGQVLFQPPNVAGWPEGRAWIDSSSLMARLRLPRALLADAEIGLQPKASFAGNEDGLPTRGDLARRLRSTIDWTALEAAFAGADTATLAAYLLQTPALRIDPAASGTDLRGRVLRLIATPEFQLC
ncbi:MAG: DUF1800 domain-containing protein [Bacteroidia bacterium]